MKTAQEISVLIIDYSSNEGDLIAQQCCEFCNSEEWLSLENIEKLRKSPMYKSTAHSDAIKNVH